jgi:tryptophanyl-tRNA synthetase
MSSSVDISAIFIGDTENAIKKKINKYAFSGGQDTAELQREKGGNTRRDISFHYLTFFLEDDEGAGEDTARMRAEMLTGA